MGENDVVRHREFDRFREDLRRELDRYYEEAGRRFDRIEDDVEQLADEHDTDMGALATQRTTDIQRANERSDKRREWTWGQVVVLSGTAVAALALWLQTVGR